MTLLSQLLPPANVKLGIQATSKKALFEQAAALFCGSQLLNHAQVMSSLMERERLGSTALGQGIAIPHGRVKGLREAVGAFLRADVPLEFEAPDGKPVSLIFVLLVPERATDQHLQILSELAQMFSDRDVRRQLSQASDGDEAQRIIAGWEPTPAAPLTRN